MPLQTAAATFLTTFHCGKGLSHGAAVLHPEERPLDQYQREHLQLPFHQGLKKGGLEFNEYDLGSWRLKEGQL